MIVIIYVTVSLLIYFPCLGEALESDKEDLEKELEIMKSLEPHKHVISLLLCVTETGTACIDPAINVTKSGYHIELYWGDRWCGRVYN